MVSAILHSLAGFYLQLLPCAFFCIYPFIDDFRYPKKRVIGILSAILIIMSVIFTCMYVAMDIPSGAYNSFLPLNLIFLLTVGILVALFFLCTRAAVSHMLYTVVLALNYGFLVSMIHGWFVDVKYLYDTGVLLAQLVSTIILFYPMLRVMKLVRSAFDSQIEPKVWKWFTLIPGTFFMAMLLFYQIPISNGWTPNRILSVFTRAMCILMLIITAIILRAMQTIQQQASKQASLEIAVNHYKLMAENTDKERELRHEFRHHMTALSILLKNQDYQGAENYLNRISQIDAGNTDAFYTPHILLNSMLAEYEKRARTANIASRYSIQVPHPILMEDMDLCQFLSNMLDNALEAVSGLEEERRHFSLTIRQSGNFLYFLCENPCEPALLNPAGSGFDTNKSNETAHGYGFPIMKRIAEKYNGIFRADIKDNIFTVTANLCTSPRKLKGI